MHLLRASGWRACLPLTLVLASCSGGSSPSTLAANANSGATASKATQTVPASLTFVIPRTAKAASSKRITPQYLAASTTSIQITLVQVNGSAPSPTPAPTIVTVSGSICTSTNANYTCTVPLALPVGSDKLLAQAYDGANASGNMLSSQQGTFTITAAGTNTLSMTLDASPGTITVTPPVAVQCSGSPLACIEGVAGQQPFDVSVADAHGTALASNAIAGSPVISVASSNTAVATVTAMQNPYRIEVTAVGDGTASIAVTASPATNTSGLTPTTYTFTFTVAFPIVVTTLAGSSGQGHADGTGAAASFAQPTAVAVDTAGNVYVADFNNNEIRKVTSAGVVTTLAGSTTAGSADGTGSAASFRGPYGVAVDTAGNVYVADVNNARIRKITSAGVVTTLAGSTTGNIDGTGSAAKFNSPIGLTVDAAGNVYVADFGNNEIRKVTSAGVVTTLAGSSTIGSADGTGTGARFNHPRGVAVDTAGNLYVADSSNDEIRKISSAGVVTTLAGSTSSGSVDGTGPAASFNGPIGIAVDSIGTIYVADTGNCEIRKITAAGAVTTFAGSVQFGNANGIGTAASFFDPAGVAVDAARTVYVGDTQNNEIRKITQ